MWVSVIKLLAWFLSLVPPLFYIFLVFFWYVLRLTVYKNGDTRKKKKKGNISNKHRESSK